MGHRLNGWHRLWIVFSFLYLFAVIAFGVIVWPKKTTQIDKNFLNEVYRLIDEADGKTEKYRFSDIVEEINRRGLYDKPKDEEEKLMASEAWALLAERAISKYKDKIDFSNARTKYKRDLKKVSAERKQLIFLSLLFWFLPVVAIFLLGLSVRWIIRGFRESRNA